MPLYEYKCEKCGHQFEKIQKFSDKMVKKCPECGGRVEQMISAPAVQFKGSGWYVTDYANKSHAPSSDGGKDSKDSKKDGAAKSDSSSKEGSSKEGSSKESSSSSKESSKDSSSKETSSKQNSSRKSEKSK
ncbi:MAG TPA: zinc ribbon domain-containing protein [Candidatus Sulfotelmatobacter sp.]|nr:zinc ribbon domain-containing protein [Candidatus Sulfotelmatobacter sp.]